MSSADPRRIHLQRALATFRPSDDRESGFCRRMVTLLTSPGDPFSRDHFNPGHFTASAFILSPDRQHLLLALHAKLGRWLQPGGHVEASDADVLAAARREVSEETGLTGLEPLGQGVLDIDVHAVPPLFGSPEHAHFDVRYLFVAPTTQARAASDARSLRWVPLASVDDVESDASVMRAVSKIVRVLG
ncbi:MAG: NUDIX domain-containing protein [Myxococcales bacterium]|nr:NUDIX domain-containing protein [Myxococcales bacterium]